MPDDAMLGQVADHDSGKSGGPRSVIRVMDILDQLARAPTPFSLSYISEALDLPKTSTFNLLKALEKGGYVSQEAGGYRLGPEAFRLASAISSQQSLPSLLRPVLENVARQCGETILLGELADSGIEARYADVIESRSPLRFTVQIGDLRPLHCSTTGKLFLAHFAEKSFRAYLSEIKREQYTPRTITKKSDLITEIASIRKKRVAENIDGMVEGITSYGVPAYDHDGVMRAALVISGPDVRMGPKASEIKELLLGAGREMSRLLNGSEQYPPSKIAELD
jgi:DNA-binding IclR family transcriptional regulator